MLKLKCIYTYIFTHICVHFICILYICVIHVLFLFTFHINVLFYQMCTHTPTIGFLQTDTHTDTHKHIHHALTGFALFMLYKLCLYLLRFVICVEAGSFNKSSTKTHRSRTRQETQERGTGNREQGTWQSHRPQVSVMN